MLELVLGSLNLHAGRDRTGRPFSVAAALDRLAADVVVLQENWRPRGSDSVARRAARECGYHQVEELDLLTDTTLHRLGLVRTSAQDERGAWGLAVVSRRPLIRTEPVWLGTAHRDPSARAAQVLEVGARERPVFRLVNVHLTYRLWYGPGQLRGLLRSLAKRPAAPTVIAGDFNMCRPFIYLARGYRRAVRGRTWPADHPLAQLDHVLTGPGVCVARAGAAAAVGSDHQPVWAVLHVSRPLPAAHDGQWRWGET